MGGEVATRKQTQEKKHVLRKNIEGSPWTDDFWRLEVLLNLQELINMGTKHCLNLCKASRCYYQQIVA